MSLNMRQFLRADKKLRLEFTLFPPPVPPESPHLGQVQNIGGGGFLFHTSKKLDPETQIMVTLFLTGWEAQGKDIVEAEDPTVELPLKVIALVLRSDFDSDHECWATAVQFQGRVHDGSGKD